MDYLRGAAPATRLDNESMHRSNAATVIMGVIYLQVQSFIFQNTVQFLTMNFRGPYVDAMTGFAYRQLAFPPVRWSPV